MVSQVITNMHYRYLNAAKIHVCYLTTESKGNPVLLIHGLGGSIESWINNVEIIPSHGFQVIALDLPGFGLSDKPQITYSIKYYSKFISNLSDNWEYARLLCPSLVAPLEGISRQNLR